MNGASALIDDAVRRAEQMLTRAALKIGTRTDVKSEQELRECIAMAMSDVRHAAAAHAKNAAGVQWPSSRDVARLEDMSPDGHMRVLLDSDCDVLVEVCDGKRVASVEFCNPGGGGGQSARTRLALIEVMRAIEADNNERPSRAHPMHLAVGKA